MLILHRYLSSFEISTAQNAEEEKFLWRISHNSFASEKDKVQKYLLRLNSIFPSIDEQ